MVLPCSTLRCQANGLGVVSTERGSSVDSRASSRQAALGCQCQLGLHASLMHFSCYQMLARADPVALRSTHGQHVKSDVQVRLVMRSEHVVSAMHLLQALLCSIYSRGSIVNSHMVNAVSSQAISKIAHSAECNVTASHTCPRQSDESIRLTAAQSK